MKRLSLLEIGSRLEGAIYDTSDNASNSLSIKQVIVGALAVATIASGINQAFAMPSITEPLVATSSRAEQVHEAYSFTDSALALGKILAKTNKSNSNIDFAGASRINSWSDMQSAVKAANSQTVVLIESPYAGVEITYLVNAKGMKANSETYSYQKVQDEIAQHFKENVELAQVLSPRYLKKAPQLITNRSKANAELNHFNASLEPMAFKTVASQSEEYLKVNVVHVEQLHRPAYELMNEISDQDYPLYNGPLVDQKRAREVTVETASEISATFIAMHELGHSYMYRTLDVDKAMEDITQGSSSVSDVALSEFLSMTYSEAIADSTMLIAGAKSLQSNEWESLKLDYLTMRGNPEQYKTTSTNAALAHNTTFFTKPLISFLNQYRQQPDNYPEFNDMTADLNTTATAMTLLYHQMQIHSGSSVGQLLEKHSNDTYAFSKATESTYLDTVSALLGSKEHRFELLNATGLAKQVSEANHILEAKMGHNQDVSMTPNDKYVLTPY